jgi:hypothetical protein
MINVNHLPWIAKAALGLELKLMPYENLSVLDKLEWLVIPGLAIFLSGKNNFYQNSNKVLIIYTSLSLI